MEAITGRILPIDDSQLRLYEIEPKVRPFTRCYLQWRPTPEGRRLSLIIADTEPTGNGDCLEFLEPLPVEAVVDFENLKLEIAENEGTVWFNLTVGETSRHLTAPKEQMKKWFRFQPLKRKRAIAA